MTIVIQSPDTPVDPETPIEKKIVRKMNAVAGGGKTKANRNNGKENKKVREGEAVRLLKT